MQSVLDCPNACEPGLVPDEVNHPPVLCQHTFYSLVIANPIAGVGSIGVALSLSKKEFFQTHIDDPGGHATADGSAIVNQTLLVCSAKLWQLFTDSADTLVCSSIPI